SAIASIAPLTGDVFPEILVPLLVAVLAAAYYGGTGAALTAAVAGYLLSDAYLITPGRLATDPDQATLVLLVAVALGVGWLADHTEAEARRRDQLRRLPDASHPRV